MIDATEKTVLESYNNLSLDPYASNFISKVVGDTKYTLVHRMELIITFKQLVLIQTLQDM